MSPPTDLPFGRFFKPHEFACHDSTRTPYPEEWIGRFAVLLNVCDTIREAWGAPITIVSGYRTPAWNKGRGVDKSQHVEGRAVDLRPYPHPPETRSAATIHRFHRLINRLLDEGKLPAVGGVGVYPLVEDSRSHIWVPGWVHVDTRQHDEGGHIARWEGSAVGHEQTPV